MLKTLVPILQTWWDDPVAVNFYEQHGAIIINDFHRFLGTVYFGPHRELLVMLPSSDLGQTLAVHVKRVVAAAWPPWTVRSIYIPETPTLPRPHYDD